MGLLTMLRNAVGTKAERPKLLAEYHRLIVLEATGAESDTSAARVAELAAKLELTPERAEHDVAIVKRAVELKPLADDVRAAIAEWKPLEARDLKEAERIMGEYGGDYFARLGASGRWPPADTKAAEKRLKMATAARDELARLKRTYPDLLKGVAE